MRKLAALVMLAAACGGGGDRPGGELAAVTFVIGVDPAAIEVVGQDRIDGAGPLDQREDRLEVVAVELDGAEVREVFADTPPLADPARMVRNPLVFDATSTALEGAERVLILVIPLIDPTVDENAHEGRLVVLGPGGELLHADFDEGPRADLARLLEEGEPPVEVVWEAARAVVDASLGRELTPRQERLVEVVGG